jgi:hypothetical protein
MESAIRDFATSPWFKNVLITAGIGLVLGLVAKSAAPPKDPGHKQTCWQSVLKWGMDLVIANRYYLLRNAVLLFRQRPPGERNISEMALKETVGKPMDDAYTS